MDLLEGIHFALRRDLLRHPLLELLGGLHGDEPPHPGMAQAAQLRAGDLVLELGFPSRVRISAVVTLGTNQMGIVRPGMASCFTRNSGTPKL